MGQSLEFAPGRDGINMSAASLYAMRLAIVGLQFAASLVLALLMDRTEFGAFIVLWAVANVLSSLASFGSPQFLLRTMSMKQGDPSRGLSWTRAATYVFVIPIVLLILTYPIIVMTSDLLKIRAVDQEVAVVTVLFTAYSLSLLAHSCNPIRVLYGPTWGMMVRDATPHLAIILSALSYYVAGLEMNYYTLLIYSSLGGFCVTIITLVILVNTSGIWRVVNRRAVPGPRYEFSFWGTSLVSVLGPHLEVFVGGFLFGPVAVGNFQIIRKLANFISLPQIVANWIIAVPVGRYYSVGSRIGLQSLAAEGLRLAVAPALALAVALAAAFPFLLDLYDIEPTNEVLAAGLMVGIAAAANVLFGANFLLASQCGQERSALLARLAGIVTGGAVVVIAWNFGTVGAMAIAACISTLASNFYVWRVIKNSINVDTSVASWFRTGTSGEVPKG